MCPLLGGSTIAHILQANFIFHSASRPDTGMSKSDQPHSKTVSGSIAEDSSEDGSLSASQSSFSKLSSQRGFSPTDQLASPVSTD